MRNTINKFNERNEKQNQSKNPKINKIQLPSIYKSENKIDIIQLNNHLRNPQSANFSNKIINNAIEIGKKIYHRHIITPNLVNIYSILEKENKEHIINNINSKSSPKNMNINNINNNKNDKIKINDEIKNKFNSSINRQYLNIIGTERNKNSELKLIKNDSPIKAKEQLCYLNKNNINKYLNSNIKNNINKNNKIYKNVVDNNSNQLNYFSKINSNKQSNLLKKIEIPYLINGKKINNKEINIFESINRKEISKEASNNDNIKQNNKRTVIKKKYNSQLKISEKKYYIIENISQNNTNNNSKIKNIKENLCFISYSYNEYSNIPYRKSMEDYHCIKQDLLKTSPMHFSYFAIFDGHCGNEVALFLSKYLHKILSKNLTNLKITNNDIETYNNNIISSIKKTFEIVDEEIINNIAYSKDVGSTGTVILLYKIKNEDKNNDFSRYMVCANIGDSRGYILTKNNFTQITKDHKCNDVKEVERIKKNGGIVFNNRVYGTLMITRSFGDKEMKKYGVISTPDCFCHKIREEDLYIVIASDGIWDVVSEEEMMQMGGEKYSSDVFSKKIVNLAIDRGTRDNISCIVIKLNKDI